MQQLQFAQVVGQPGDDRWSQVVVFPASLAGVDAVLDISENGALVVAMTVTGREKVSGQELGHKLVMKLGKLVEDEGEDLTVIKVQEVFEENKDRVDVVAGLFYKNKADVVGWGQGRALLVRGGEVGQVYKGRVNEWQAVGGKWQDGDRWLVGTEGLVGEMSRQLIEDVLTLGLVEAGDELVTRVQAAEDSAGVAGAIIQLKDGEGGVVKSEERSKEKEDEKVEVNATDRVDEGQEPKIYLKGKLKKKKAAMSLGVLLLLVLLVSVVLGWRKREQVRLEANYDAIETEVNTKVEAALQIEEANPLQAKQLASEAVGLVEGAEIELFEVEEYKIKLDELKMKTDEVYAQVSGEKDFLEVPVWFDLNLVKEGMFGEELAVSEGKLVVLDAQKDLLASIGLEQKQAELVGGGDLMKGSKLVDVQGGRAVVLADQGVVDVVMNKKTTALLIEKESDWQRVGGVGIFSGNVYVADAGAGVIWRYPGLSKGVGERQRWFGVGVEPDLSSMVDMVIDGDIWIVDGSGDVHRFRRGAVENFLVSGLENEMSDVGAIYTNVDSEKVYVLDRGGRRVVVLNKETGDYERQLLWEGLAGVNDMVVDEEGGKVLVLSGASVYGLPLED